MAAPLTIAFFGASGGCGLAALKRCLDAGHTCIALCRYPEKLTTALSGKANLVIVQGNAHSVDDVAKCLTRPGQPQQLVDAVCSTIGSGFDLKKMTFADPEVCEKGIDALLAALKRLREAGAAGATRLVVISSTGISQHARDVPLAMLPMYRLMLKIPHADKKLMEERLVASDEVYAIVRPSFLTDGASDKTVRAGIEDPRTGVESKAVGYTISRQDTAGGWLRTSSCSASRST